MHSGRMHTGRSLTVCCSVLPGGGWFSLVPGGVCLVRGVCLVPGGFSLVRGGSPWSGGFSLVLGGSPWSRGGSPWSQVGFSLVRGVLLGPGGGGLPGPRGGGVL